MSTTPIPSLLLIACAALPAAEGPRLLVDADELARIRAAAAVAGSHHAEALAATREWCDRLGEAVVKGRDRSTGNWAYDRSYLAVKAAAVHAVTGEAAYAELALRSLEAITADPDPEKRTMENGTGLSRATVTVGYALAWDLASAAWPADRRDKVLATMRSAAAKWDGAGHMNISGEFHSNWTSVMRGGEILLRLVLREPASPRMDQIVDELRKHMDSHGSAGWSQEGPIYLGYSMAFGAPAALALERAGRPEVAEAMRAKAFWRLPMRTGAFAAGQFAPAWGVGGPYYDERGWLSLQPRLVPSAELPGYLWFYDRYRGIANPAPGKDKFDHRGWGQAFALLGYPAGVAPADPTPTAAGVLTDSHGGAFWRPRWRDAGDPVVGLIADSHAAPRAWDNLDAGNLALIAHGSVFAAAAGNASSERLGDDVSRLVFGGRSNPDTALTGKLLYAEGDAAGMRAGVGYAAAVRGTGPTGVDRHVGAIAADDDTALLVVDTWEMRGTQPVAWTLNQMDGIAGAEPLEDGGRPGFLIRGLQGGWLAGWLVHPTSAELSPRDPLKLSWSAADSGTCAVALVMGSGPRPVPQSLGDGPEGEVRVAGVSLRWDAKARRVAAARLPGPRPDFTASAVSGTAPLRVRVAAAAGLEQVRWSVDGRQVATGASAEIVLAAGGMPRIRLDSAQGAAELPVQVLNRAPVARIAADRTFGPAPLAVRLDASGSTDPDDHALTYAWQLPDGERVEGPVLARTFTGTAPVIDIGLVVADAHGGKTEAVQRILVGNQPPTVAAAITPRRGPPPLAVRLDASGSRDPEGGALTVTWQLPGGATATGAEAGATISEPGLHRIRCAVRDAGGATASEDLLVEVANQPPAIRIGLDLPPMDPKTLAKDPAEQSRRRWGVDIGKDGNGPIAQPLRAAPYELKLAATASDPEGGPVTVAWDFGDGASASGPAAAHIWTKPGHYRVTATASDAQGQSASAQMIVEVDDAVGRIPDGPDGTVPGLFWENAFNNQPHIWRQGRPTSVPADAPRPPPAGASGGGMVPPSADPRDLHGAIASFLTLDRAERGVISQPIPERTAQRSFRWVTAYAGYLDAPADGEYAFELPCMAAGQLWIGQRLVCFRPELKYNNWDIRAAGRISLRKGLHGIRIMHAWDAFNGTKPELQPVLRPRWQPPGSAAPSDIPNSAWRRAASMPELVLDLHPQTLRPGERLSVSVLRSRAGADASLADASWDFGDGAAATGIDSGHVYDKPGEYRLTVRVRNSRGAEDVLTRSILVGERMPAISASRLAPGLYYRYYKSDDSFNRMPDFASWRPTASGVVAEPDISSADQPDFFAFQFAGYLHVPQSGVYRFKVDSDDGGILYLDGRVVVDNSIITPEIQNATGDVGLDAGLHRLAIDYFEGIIGQRIKLLVQEPGETDWKPVPAGWYWRDDGANLDRQPTAAISVPEKAAAGAPVRLDASASGDPDGDPIVVSWDLGDGRTLHGPQVTALWREPGTYTVTATVRAHRGEPVSRSARIAVATSANRAPTVRMIAPMTTSANALAFTATAETSDPDGDPVTCTWDFGDGARATGTSARRLLGGGRWLVTVTADDGRGGVAYATQMVEVAMPATRSIGAYLVNPRGRGRLTGAASVAGFIPQANWNVIAEKTATALVDSRGDPSGAAIPAGAVSSLRGDEFPSTPSTSGEAGLHGTIGTVANAGGRDGGMIIEGVPYARYDVLVGLAGVRGNAKRPAPISVNGQTRVLFPRDGWADAYIPSQADQEKDVPPGGNLAIFIGLAGPTVRIIGPFSWFQIVERR